MPHRPTPLALLLAGLVTATGMVMAAEAPRPPAPRTPDTTVHPQWVGLGTVTRALPTAAWPAAPLDAEAVPPTVPPTRFASLAQLVAATEASVPVISRNTGTLWLAADNDVVFNTDEDYTNGGLLGWISAPTPTWETIPGFGWMSPALSAIPGFRQGDRWKSVSLEGAHLMFTPDKIGHDNPQPGTRPFAGVFYTSLGAHLYNRHHLDSLDLVVGMIGPATQAEEAQEITHELIGAADPDGWDDQIGNELLVNLGYEHRYRAIELGDIHERLGTDLILGIGGTVGNLRTAAQLDLTCRVGYRALSGFGNTSLDPISSGRLTPGFNGNLWGCYLMAGVTFEAVAHDATLDGRLFAEDAYTVDSYPWVGRAYVGVGGHVGDFQLAAQVVGSTRTYEGEEDPPAYGRALIGWTF